MDKLTTKKILIVDDEPNNLQVLRMILKEGYQLSFATNGKVALDIAIKHRPDLILLDIMMPEMNGFEVCRKLKTNSITATIPVIFVSASGDVEDKTMGFDAGAIDFILKPVSEPIVLQRIKTYLSLAHTKELVQVRQEALATLGEIGHYHDPGSEAHIKRVAGFARLIAENSGWLGEKAEQLELAAPLHDIGNIAIPDLILKAPRKLNKREWKRIKSHPTVGRDIICKNHAAVFTLAAEIAYGHHEKWNGNGYPNGLAGESIPESARIVAVADVFDALTMKRPYRNAWSIDDAMAEIEKGAGSHFDPGITDIFVRNRANIIRIKQAGDPEK